MTHSIEQVRHKLALACVRLSAMIDGERVHKIKLLNIDKNLLHAMNQQHQIYVGTTVQASELEESQKRFMYKESLKLSPLQIVGESRLVSFSPYGTGIDVLINLQLECVPPNTIYLIKSNLKAWTEFLTSSLQENNGTAVSNDELGVSIRDIFIAIDTADEELSQAVNRFSKSKQISAKPIGKEGNANIYKVFEILADFENYSPMSKAEKQRISKRLLQVQRTPKKTA